MIFLSNRKLKLIIITLLLMLFCFFLGMFKPKALTNTADIQEINVSYNHTTLGKVSYNNISHFMYDGMYYSSEYFNETFGQYALGANTYMFSQSPAYATDNINYYFNNPCNNEDLSWQSVVVFYYMEGKKIDFTKIPIIYGNSGCTGQWLPYGENDYILSSNCTASKGSPAAISFYFNELPLTTNSYSSYRVGIQKAFNYTCAVNTNSIVENNNINTQREINSINDVNNSLNDSSIDSNNASSSANEWNSKNATNGTITSLLTLPITLLQAIVNGLQTSCSSFSLGSLFGTNISLPCIDIGNLIGNGLWTTIDFLFSGFMILAISKKLIKIFNDFTNLKSNQIDELYGGDK